jgi:oxygen-dependent protoporphyrinogen oxidase
VVVGGGVAGLVWALEAAIRGLAVTVLEAADRPGGAVRRGQVGRVTAELGAEAFAVARPEVLALADELGLADQVVRPATSQAHLATSRGLVALPPGFLGVPVDLEDVARLLGREAAAEAARRDAVPVGPDEELPVTLGELVRVRLGDAVATQLVDPVVAGVHATPADEAELASVAPPLADAVRHHGGLVAAARALRGPLGPAGAPVASLDGGLSRLVDALVRRLEAHGVSVRTGTVATGLRRRADGWRVATASGYLDAEVLGVALPVDATARLLATATDATAGHGPAATTSPDGPLDAIARALGDLRQTEVTLVSLLVASPALTAAGAPVGSGVLVAPDMAAVRAKAMTHASAKWAHVAAALPADQHLLRLSYGGRSATAEGRSSDEELVRTALTDAARLLGMADRELALRGARVTRWRHGLVRPLVGRRASIDRIDRQLGAVPDLALLGGAVAGNGLAGVVARSRAEGTRTLG